MQKHSSQYDFPTKIVPVDADGIRIPYRFAVIRTDTGQPLGIISERYKLIPHKEVLERSREALMQDELKFEEKVSVTKNGAHCLIQYTFPTAKIEIQTGDFVSLQITIINSYDASTSIRFLIGAFRLVCSNGLVIGKELAYYFLRHTSELDANVIQERFRDVSRHFNKSVVPVMSKMSESELSKEKSSQLLKKYKNKNIFPHWLIEDAQERYQKEKPTVWNFYNALTYFITHGRSEMNIETRIRHSKKAWQEAVRLL